MLYLSEKDVQRFLTPQMALDGVEEAHLALASGRAVDEPRRRTKLKGATLHILQGAVLKKDNDAEGVIGYKAYTSSRHGEHYHIHTYNAADGKPIAILEANYLGMLRTGAASALAAKTLARPDARVAGVFGAGWQARGHVQMLCTTLPRLEFVKIWSRQADRRQAFAEQLSALTGRKVCAASSPEETTSGSDIIGTITTSSSPLFEPDWLDDGTHINAAGSNSLIRQEIGEAVLKRCDIYCVDSVDTSMLECGDLLPLLEKGRLRRRQMVELGDILVGRSPGRTSSKQITLFESHGIAAQDLAVANRVLQAAKAEGIGCEIGKSNA